MGKIWRCEMARQILLWFAVLVVAGTAIPLTEDTAMWAEELISLKSSPAQATMMSPEQLAAMTNRILLKANAMRRRLNQLGISDADTDDDVETRYAPHDGRLGEAADLESEKTEVHQARASLARLLGALSSLPRSNVMMSSVTRSN